MEKLESLDQILEILRTVKPDVESRYQVDELAIFGSYRRGDQRPGSDLDPISLIKIIELENFLTDRLGVRVDLVMRDALKPYIGKQILKEIVAV
jgi:predicted nucleotidyltransferase